MGRLALFAVLLFVVGCGDGFKSAGSVLTNGGSPADGAAGVSLGSGQAAGAASHGSAAPDHVSVPINQMTLKTGGIKYLVNVKVGNSGPFKVLVDTGSIGLRFVKSALTPDDYVDTGVASNYAYGSGLSLKGTTAMSTISIGGLATTKPIAIQLVSTVGCLLAKPDCMGSLGDNSSIYGDPDYADLKGVMGIGLDASTADNPLLKLGNGAWIISLPIPSATAPGSLLLQPTAADLAGFTILQVSPQAAADAPAGVSPTWSHFLDGCLNDLTTKVSVCGPTALDTGGGQIFHEISISPTLSPSVVRWAAGDAASLVLTDVNGIQFTERFTVGSDIGSAITVFSDQSLSRDINTGDYPFFHNQVYYSGAGKIGLKPSASP